MLGSKNQGSSSDAPSHSVQPWSARATECCSIQVTESHGPGAIELRRSKVAESSGKKSINPACLSRALRELPKPRGRIQRLKCRVPGVSVHGAPTSASIGVHVRARSCVPTAAAAGARGTGMTVCRPVRPSAWPPRPPSPTEWRPLLYRPAARQMAEQTATPPASQRDGWERGERERGKRERR